MAADIPIAVPNVILADNDMLLI